MALLQATGRQLGHMIRISRKMGTFLNVTAQQDTFRPSPGFRQAYHPAPPGYGEQILVRERAFMKDTERRRLHVALI